MVKCVECGFLAARNVESRVLEEAEERVAHNQGTTPTVRRRSQ